MRGSNRFTAYGVDKSGSPAGATEEGPERWPGGFPKGERSECEVSTAVWPTVFFWRSCSDVTAGNPVAGRARAASAEPQAGRQMGVVQIRASNDEDHVCLMRELVAFGPKRSRRSVFIELEEPSQSDLLGLLSALETCLSENEIRSVRLTLDGNKYLVSPV